MFVQMHSYNLVLCYSNIDNIYGLDLATQIDGT